MIFWTAIQILGWNKNQTNRVWSKYILREPEITKLFPYISYDTDVGFSYLGSKKTNYVGTSKGSCSLYRTSHNQMKVVSLYRYSYRPIS